MTSIKVRDFYEDLKQSNNSKIIKQWETIFKKIFGKECIIKFQNNKTAQLDFGTDTIIQDKKGRKFSIEFKTRHNDYYGWKDYLLEIKHLYYKDLNSAKEYLKEGYLDSKEGWLYCSTANYIFYGTLNKEKNKIIEICGFSLEPFRNIEFAHTITNLKSAWAKDITPYPNCYQRTLNKKASLQFLKNNANKFWYWREDEN